MDEQSTGSLASGVSLPLRPSCLTGEEDPFACSYSPFTNLLPPSPSDLPCQEDKLSLDAGSGSLPPLSPSDDKQNSQPDPWPETKDDSLPGSAANVLSGCSNGKARQEVLSSTSPKTTAPSTVSTAERSAFLPGQSSPKPLVENYATAGEEAACAKGEFCETGSLRKLLNFSSSSFATCTDQLLGPFQSSRQAMEMKSQKDQETTDVNDSDLPTPMAAGGCESSNAGEASRPSIPVSENQTQEDDKQMGSNGPIPTCTSPSSDNGCKAQQTPSNCTEVTLSATSNTAAQSKEEVAGLHEEAVQCSSSSKFVVTRSKSVLSFGPVTVLLFSPEEHNLSPEVSNLCNSEAGNLENAVFRCRAYCQPWCYPPFIAWLQKREMYNTNSHPDGALRSPLPDMSSASQDSPRKARFKRTMDKCLDLLADDRGAIHSAMIHTTKKVKRTASLLTGRPKHAGSKYCAQRTPALPFRKSMWESDSDSHISPST